MAKAAVTKSKHSLILKLLILLSCGSTRLLAEAATLCCSFSVSNSVSGLPSYEVESQVKTEHYFLSRNNKCHATGVLLNRLNATEICEKQFYSLKGQVDHLQDMLYQIQGKNKTITEPQTLQCIKCGWCAEDGCVRGSWKVRLNGSIIFHGDTKKRLHIYSGDNWTKEILDNIRNMNDFLNQASHCELKNKFKEYMLQCKENLVPTALPIITAYVDKSATQECMSNPSILLIMLSCFLLYVF
ncbi:UL16-binding protein 2-like [Apodemus sylvaticus]|uniref:UL16-binding protein 2-like n=1 Tax=Apodemus sylvaticus TaxID=10129 RepID=UPI00224485C9|nr:UL16-binding protein 2-like [Apodemus sylvaticus]